MSRVRLLKRDEVYISKPTYLMQKANIEKQIQLKADLYNAGYTLSGNIINLAIKPRNWWVDKTGSDEDKALAMELLEKFKVCQLKYQYIGKSISDVNDFPDNIISYVEGEERFSARFEYYRELIKKKNYKNREGVKRNDTEVDISRDFDLEEYVRYRGPVVVAQEFYGCGASCSKANSKNPVDGFKTESEAKAERKRIADVSKTYKIKYGDVGTYKEKDQTLYRITGMSYETEPQCDVYDDRITKIYENRDSGLIIIQEFYRANVDVSIKYWQNLIKDPQCKSTAAGVYDFIVGESGEIKLYSFDSKCLEEIVNKIRRDEGIKKYNENSFIQSDFFKYPFDSLRKAKDVADVGKTGINLHSGSNDYTSSQGCFTILKGKDYNQFMSSFEIDKLGLLFLFRDEL